MNDVVLRTLQNTDWITLILCCSILAIVVAKSFFYQRFYNFIILPFNNKYIFMYNKKDKLSHWFTIFLFIFQLLNLALFIYLVARIFSISDQNNSEYIYFIILGSLFLFFSAKILLHLGNAFVFNTSGIISEFLFKKISYQNYSGFIMFIANILLTYVLKDSKTIIYVSSFLILLINAIGWVTVIRNHQKLITNNFFYFILYLCALEITPLVLIGDYFKD
tara:strand:- start:7470 stop:8129 length:660 start_codon:yes stop_codon:yes gene_type:complete